MVVDRAIDANEVGRTFAQHVQNTSDVVGVWVRLHREVFEVWVQTEPISTDREYELYSLVRLLHETFPHALIRFHLINPCDFDEPDENDLAVDAGVPQNAEPIPLQTE